MFNLTVDLKARLKNKTWWVAMIGSVILLAKQFGFDLEQYIPNYANVVNTVFVMLAMVGITADTSTKGLSDQAISSATAINDTVSENSQESANEIVTPPVDAVELAAQQRIISLKAELAALQSTAGAVVQA